jgi:hypothetical protein
MRGRQMSRKIVYVAHPYQLKPENKESVEEIIINLIEKYPDITFFSPIHATGYYYDKKTWAEGMIDCVTLLSRCDELLLCPGHENSRGCNYEVEFAKSKGIPIKYLSEYEVD